MTFFFDRDVGICLPKALMILRLPVCYHQQHFAIDSKDDDWMPVVGRNGWILVGHDSKHHLLATELYAIKQYDLGCFYLWGGSATRWQKMICFARAYSHIIAACLTPKPFLYKVSEKGKLTSISIS
jgi:hypothetical protein